MPVFAQYKSKTLKMAVPITPWKASTVFPPICSPAIRPCLLAVGASGI